MKKLIQTEIIFQINRGKDALRIIRVHAGMTLRNALWLEVWHDLLMIQILIGIGLNLYINVGRIDIFTKLNLIVHEHSISSV